MNSLEGFNPKVAQRNPVIEEINDYENAEIREILVGASVVMDGDEITEADYQAIKTRAEFLANKAGETPISAKALLLCAYADRMEHLGKITEDDLKKLPSEAVRAIMYARTGYDLNDEEIELVRNSPLSLGEEYAEQRKSSRKGVADFDVAVNKTGSVVASCETPEEALRHAQGER